MALSPDKRVLCLDGVFTSGLNLAVATDIADRGFAVVRSSGGDRARAIELANMVRDRDAIVVVRDVCLYACASFLVLASSETYVLEGALLAWGVSRSSMFWIPRWHRRDGTLSHLGAMFSSLRRRKAGRPLMVGILSRQNCGGSVHRSAREQVHQTGIDEFLPCDR
jgi:hypothetical protein